MSPSPALFAIKPWIEPAAMRTFHSPASPESPSGDENTVWRTPSTSTSPAKNDSPRKLVQATFVNHDPATGESKGPQGTRELIEGYRTAFPDIKITVEEQIAEGDLVATRWTAKGTHKGELMGIAPTGKESTVTGVTIDKIKDGKIVESWNNWDTLGMMQQLGVIPALATA